MFRVPPQIDRRRCGIVYYNGDLQPSARLRKQLYQLLEKDDKLTFCGSDPHLYITRWLASADKAQKKTVGVSSTLQFFAEYIGSLTGNKKVMIKISFRKVRGVAKTDNSLETERRIYRQVVNPLIFNRNTPHLTVFYTEIKTCTAGDLLRKYMKNNEYANADKLIKDLQKIQNEGYDVRQMRALVTERASGKTLKNYMDEQTVSLSFWEPVMFQILWTLLCFKEVGLSHNDLHSENVFISELKEPVTRFYYYNADTVFRFDTKYFVQIFDFDRSSKVPTRYDPCHIVNTLLSSGRQCEAYGFCNTYYEKRDITRLFFYIYIGCAPRVRAWLASLNVVDFSFLRKLDSDGLTPGSVAWYGALCQVLSEGRCRQIAASDEQVKPLSYMLKKFGSAYQVRSKPFFPYPNICEQNNVWVLPSRADALGLKSCGINKVLYR